MSGKRIPYVFTIHIAHFEHWNNRFKTSFSVWIVSNGIQNWSRKMSSNSLNASLNWTCEYKWMEDLKNCLVVNSCTYRVNNMGCEVFNLNMHPWALSITTWRSSFWTYLWTILHFSYFTNHQVNVFLWAEILYSLHFKAQKISCATKLMGHNSSIFFFIFFQVVKCRTHAESEYLQ